MKELLAGWIVFQLIIIGIASINQHNQVASFNYDCKLITAPNEVPAWYGVVVPLAAFVPTPQTVIEYCELNREVQDDKAS